jgi:hypothetical protein|tara:strand:- start:574 stop:1221 length:648 start_codon:yes stop_codon:yes gene_type:complete
MQIFIGYEESHPEMYEVCKASIERFSSSHTIRPLRKQTLQVGGVYTREYQGEATDFAFTRFLVPFLAGYQGYALFCDGDFMWRSDPAELEQYQDEDINVHVVKHPELITRQGIKMDGKVNRPYLFKYWSSLMYMNCAKLEIDPNYVNQAPAGDLHGFKWTDNLGSLPATYNNMVGYYDIYNPKAVHFTDGGPWLKGYENQAYADEWRTVLNDNCK